ncbi:MAG: hypothetical protein IKW39_01835 [Alphaproteobacteria bacterium]|nr:hypothetical protein [Alphaproteobacteria bacterium]
MAEVIDFYEAKNKLEQKTEPAEYESILESPEYLRFLETSERLRQITIELNRSSISLVKTKEPV